MRGYGFWLIILLTITGVGAEAITLTRLNAPERWKRLEFRVDGVPVVANPFDPDQIAIYAAFTLPSGRTLTVPGFWYRGYTRALTDNKEVLTPQGAGEWRVRFSPTETGAYSVWVAVTRNSMPDGPPVTVGFVVAARTAAGPQGYVTVAANGRYFATDRGDPLPLNGTNVCWSRDRATYDYDTWFARMGAAGENFARLWMCPWSFGIETAATERTKYRLDRAWQLDYVFDLAEQKGLYLMLALDYHGMFETQPDYWGTNNYWLQHPYNAANGGPCASQNAFFTSEEAKSLYKKRLRYLIARYGYSTHLLAWEFFNEIDNAYRYLTPADVASWHSEMGKWLHVSDPLHLVTTSMTYAPDRPEIWSLPEIDFTQHHAYGTNRPASAIAEMAETFRTRYRKPFLVGEYGVDWRGWNRTTVDPYLRGFRQGLWGGAVGGSLGTAMSWWWENLDSENLYPLSQALHTVLSQTSWGRGDWQPVAFVPASDPPAQLGNPVLGGQPFTATLTPGTGWGADVSGVLALPDAASVSRAGTALNRFVHGSSHPELRHPFRMEVWLAQNARLTLHLNSVSNDATLQVKLDGAEIFRQNYPNRDGQTTVNNEYNLDIPVALSAGKHRIEIANPGSDWFCLDWVRIENALPAQYANDWRPMPRAIGITGSETLAYLVNPAAEFPANALTAEIPEMRGTAVTLSNWPAGTYRAIWHNPRNGVVVGETAGATANALLTLPVPAFREDLAVRILPVATVSGVVRLPGCANLAQPITFAFRPADGSTSVTRTVTLNGNGAFALTGLPRKNGTLHIKGAKWLARNLAVHATAGNVSGLSVTLPPGDSNNDNSADALDLADLIAAFNTVAGDPDWNPAADFSCDNRVDALDLALLIDGFNAEGPP